MPAQDALYLGVAQKPGLEAWGLPGSVSQARSPAGTRVCLRNASYFSLETPQGTEKAVGNTLQAQEP